MSLILRWIVCMAILNECVKGWTNGMMWKNNKGWDKSWDIKSNGKE